MWLAGDGSGVDEAISKVCKTLHAHRRHEDVDRVRALKVLLDIDLGLVPHILRIVIRRQHFLINRRRNLTLLKRLLRGTRQQLLRRGLPS
jgi:hypothetical protein